MTVRADSMRLEYNGQTSIDVVITNKSRIPVTWLMVDVGLPQSMIEGPRVWVCSLRAKTSSRVAFDFKGVKRGAFSLRAIRARLGDGLSDVEYEVHDRNFGAVSGEDEIVVYPRIWPMYRLDLPSRIPYGQQRTPIRFFEDVSRTIGIRDYMPGDNPRRIDWKATAKQNSLQVREYQPTIALDTLILLDLHMRDYPNSIEVEMAELAIETAASFAHRLIFSSMAVGLVTNVGEDSGSLCEITVRPAKGFAQLGKIMDILARVEPRDGVDFLSTVQKARLGIQPGSTVIVIVPGERRDILDACLILKRVGYRVLVTVMGGTESSTVLPTLTHHGVRVVQIFSALDLERLAS